MQRGIDANKIDVITNGVDLKNFKPLAKDEEILKKLDLLDSFVFGYVGTHGLAHSLECIITVAEKVALSHPEKNIKFIFLGDGARKKYLKELVRNKKIQNVVFLDSVSREEVCRYWSIIDVSIIHLKKTDLFKSVIPSKIFECMAMGIPILHGVQGESADIVNEYQIGKVFESENTHDLYNKILFMINNPNQLSIYKKNSIKASKYYDRIRLADKMLEKISETKAL